MKRRQADKVFDSSIRAFILTKNVLRLDDAQADEGVVAVQNSQQEVHPLQGGSDTERAV